MAHLRDEFSLLAEQRAPFAYLDSAATTLKPKPVLAALEKFYRSQTANVHRGVYALAAAATEEFENARRGVATDLGATENEIIFTSGATASLNLVAQGLRFEPGDAIVLSEAEHHSNLLPWQRTGAELRWVPVRDDGSLDENVYLNHLRAGRVKVVTLTALSHVLGNVYDLRRSFAMAREFGVAWTVADASQSILSGQNVREIGCDALVYSGHKAMGPSGIGVLFATEKLQAEMEPLLVGGGMVDEVDFPHSRWLEGPRKFEAGTPPIEQAIALGAALRFARERGPFELQPLIARAAEGLLQRADVNVYGWPRGDVAHGGILSFNVCGVHPHDVAQWLADRGVAVRAGHHCAQVLHRRLGIESGSVRVSLGPYSTRDDIELFLSALKNIESLRGPA